MIPSVGKTLIARRRAMGLTLDQVAHASRLSRQRFRWLEADEFTNFPSLAYAFTFLRFYGAVLELDVETLEARARLQCAMRDDDRPTEPDPRTISEKALSRSRKSLAMAGSVACGIALSVILAAAGLTVASHLPGKDAQTPPPALQASGKAGLLAGAP